MYALITGTIPNVPIINSAKNITHVVGYDHWFTTDYNRNQLSKISNTQCVLESLVE